MVARSRWLVTSLLALALSAGSLSSCRKGSDEPSQAQAQADIARRAEAAQQSLRALEPRFRELSTKFTALHREFDPLPPGLPEFGETRGRFYATAIGFGTLTAKLPWLSRRIAAAVSSADSAELDAITKEISRTHDEISQVDRIASDLRDRVQPFKKLAERHTAELAVGGKMVCE